MSNVCGWFSMFYRRMIYMPVSQSVSSSIMAAGVARARIGVILVLLLLILQWSSLSKFSLGLARLSVVK